MSTIHYTLALSGLAIQPLRAGGDSNKDGDPQRQREQQHAEKHAATHRLLICEDQKDAAESLAILLKSEGHEVRVVYDGASAIAQARSWQPTAVIIDIGLPGVSGYAVAQTIRSLAGGSDVLLIALTGYAAPADISMARHAGFDWHFAKPANPSFLSQVLQRPEREPIHRRDGVRLKRDAC